MVHIVLVDTPGAAFQFFLYLWSLPDIGFLPLKPRRLNREVDNFAERNLKHGDD